MVSQFILDFLHPLIFIEFKVIRIFAYILLVNAIGQFSTSLNLFYYVLILMKSKCMMDFLRFPTSLNEFHMLDRFPTFLNIR